MTFSQMEENLVYTMCINIYIQLYGKLGVIPLHRDLGKLEPISKVEALIRDACLDRCRNITTTGIKVGMSRLKADQGRAFHPAAPRRGNFPRQQRQYSDCPLVATWRRRSSSSAGEPSAELLAGSEDSVSPWQSVSTTQLSVSR